MRIPFLLLSLAALGLSVAALGPILSVPLLVSAALVVVAVLWLVAGRRRPEAVRWIVVDGSNVMYWEGEKPSLMTVRRVLVNSGAGFLVVMTGDMLRMPGLPQVPLAESIDLDGWTIVGMQ